MAKNNILLLFDNYMYQIKVNFGIYNTDIIDISTTSSNTFK